MLDWKPSRAIWTFGSTSVNTTPSTGHDVMTSTVRAIIRKGRIDTLEPINFPDGAQVVVTVRSDEDGDFWLGAAEKALLEVWDNEEDDVYAALLKE